MIVMSMSWAFATFFFQALLRTLGPPGGFGQFSWPSSDCMDRERDHVDKTVYTMSESTLSSVGGNHGNSTAEMHELEPLTAAERPDGYRNHPGRYGKPSRYQHRLSIASTSSGGSESPRSRGAGDLPRGAGTGGDRYRDPSLNKHAHRSSAEGTSLKFAEHSSPDTRHRRTSETQGDNSDNEYNDDAGVPSDLDRTAKSNTIVSMTNNNGSSDSQLSVHLVPPRTTDPTCPEAEITTDSNSNRTDVHTDKHGDMGGSGVGDGAGIWLKQSVPVAQV